MNRRHTRADYLDIIARLRAARGPTSRFTSDFIVGFPGETEDDFRDTLRLVDEVGFAGAYSFKYSPRPGHARPPTWTIRLPEDVKAERLQRLQALIDAPAGRVQRALSSARTFDVLFEKPGRHPGPDRRPLAHICSRCRSMAPRVADRRDRAGDRHRNRHQQPVRRARRTRRELRRSSPQQEPEATCAHSDPPDPRPPPPRKRRPPTQVVLAFDDNRLASHAVRPIRPEPRADRAPARRRRRAARQSRHASRARATPASRRAACSKASTSSIKRGHDLAQGDVEGAIRLAIAQGSLFDFDPAAARAGLRGDQSAQAPGARAHRRRRTPISARSSATRWCSAPAPPAPARPGSRSRMRCSCSSARKSTASSCRGRRSRPASGSASCPATCARRSIPICARSTTRCYDLMDARIVERAHADRRDRDRAARLHARPHAVERRASSSTRRRTPPRCR